MRDKYKSLPAEEKNKKGEYGKKRYHKMAEEKKQRIKEHQEEYQKNYHDAKMIYSKEKASEY